MEEYILSSIYIYPIKSLGGISLQQAQVQERGLKNDRRWMLVDEEGNFLSQRKFAQMALLQVQLQEEGLMVYHKQELLEPLFIPFNSSPGIEVKVTIWDDTCIAREVDSKITKWFTKALGMFARLVHMPESTRRQVDPTYAFDSEVVSFADAYPFLVIGQESLNLLNSKLEKPVPMNRFRPNFVFTGGQPHAEDTWNTFTIGEIKFRAAKPCARCVLTTIDQNTGIKTAEPLKTLATYRTQNNKVMFGQNLVHDGEGVIEIGDKLNVLQCK
ncbi:MOSC domain-containing protein [Pontibacter sp. KCTC 32443]|uniref:MOSC domain-containing protein n=1 Tax=Pontibacter TaxID=323449 RepID=UPI00164E8319|nr:MULTISPECIES: MOSC N-terminal beta barrel domain-containing protein [Pontibacter]MBC5774161.1 MOSC domain-containing protein [Pontibacter sp. KCTC 32443]